MGAEPARQQIDPVLLPFLAATEETESERLLERLVCENAQPVIREIVGFHVWARGWRSGRSQEGQDAEDVASDVLVQLVRRLRECKASPDDRPIHNLRGYVAVMAQNACDEYLRQKYPRRHRLKNRVRYVLTHRDDLAFWESENHRRLCGLARWRGGSEFAPLGHIQQFRDQHPELAAAAGDVERRTPADLLRAIFDWVRRPCQLDDLVTVVADWWGIEDRAPLSDSDRHGGAQPLPAPAGGLEDLLDQRLLLKRLWAEICQLPLRQRTALLLNLRDAQGRGVITLLPLTRIATIRQIAEALAMTAEQIAAVWSDLPMEDAAIARSLGVTRQQVINLRKSARERLARRTGALPK